MGENTLLEQNSNEKQSTNYLLVDESVNYLNQTRKWTMFLSVLGFVGVGFMILIGLVLMFMGPAMSQQIPSSVPFKIGYLGIIYLILGAVYFIPIYYLFTFSNKMRNALYANDMDILTSAFKYLRNYYRFIGVLVIVLISLYILIMLAVVIGVGAAGLYNL